jgi:hypothetical protein
VAAAVHTLSDQLLDQNNPRRISYQTYNLYQITILLLLPISSLHLKSKTWNSYKKVRNIVDFKISRIHLQQKHWRVKIKWWLLTNYIKQSKNDPGNSCHNIIILSSALSNAPFPSHYLFNLSYSFSFNISLTPQVFLSDLNHLYLTTESLDPKLHPLKFFKGAYRMGCHVR